MMSMHLWEILYEKIKIEMDPNGGVNGDANDF